MPAREFPAFALVVGEEGSDPIVTKQGHDFRHDQFAASDHYNRMERDLADIAGLGVRVVRYGMPWRRTESAPGVYDWALWDRALAACDAAGLEPIVDLCHFGLPDHYPGFCEASWIDGFCRYVDAFLDRYPTPRWFTPVNEPAVTAMASALIGGWNDRRASTADYGVALTNVVLANLEALARIRADRNGWWIGAEGFDVAIAASPADEPRVARRRARTRLVWDLHFGVDPDPVARDALVAVAPATLDRIAALTLTDNVIAGHDFYPTSVQVVGPRPAPLSIDERLDAYAAEARSWHARYRVPFWVAETSNLSLPLDAQVPWLEGLYARLTELASEGLPVHGLCWYSRGDQFDWQTMLLEPTGAVTEVGLFDVHRTRRAVADVFARYAAATG